MTDPNGWVTQPPSTFVRVQGTSRANLNSSLGVVLGFAADRGRYVVHLTVSQEQVSLKPENLVKASWTEQMTGQYQLLRHDPNVRRQLQSLYDQVQARTGVKPEYVGAAALLLLAVAVYSIGFSRVLMILSLVVLTLTIIAPDLTAGASRQTILQNMPRRFREVIRQNVPVIGPRIANSPYLSAAFAGIMAVLFVKSLWPSRAVVVAPPQAASFSSSLKDHYYKMGFEDARDVKPFGASLLLEADLDLEDVPVTKQRSTWQMVSTAMSAYYVYNTVAQLGRDPATGQFRMENIRPNLASLEPWKMGMLGLSLYKIVSAFW